MTLYRYRSTNRCVSLAKTTQKKFCGNPRVSLANSCTFLQQSTPPLTPPFIVMASPLPYSRMIFEATCGTISGLGSIKLISEFFTLASPHTTQSTSSEDSPKKVVSAQPSLEYLSLILFTNSESNFPCGYSTWTLTAKPTHSSTRIYNAHLDWRSTLR